jgi:hypothetical protein
VSDHSKRAVGNHFELRPSAQLWELRVRCRNSPSQSPNVIRHGVPRRRALCASMVPGGRGIPVTPETGWAGFPCSDPTMRDRIFGFVAELEPGALLF